MSVIFIEGFEEFGTSGSQAGMNRKFSSVSLPTITMVAGRDGLGSAIQCASGTQEFSKTNLPSSGAYTIGVAYKRGSTGTNTICFANATASRQITIRTTSSGRIDLCTGFSTQVAVSPNNAVPVDGNFYYITAFIDTVNSVARVQVNGVQVMSYSGSLGSAINAVGLGASLSGCEFDDWFVADHELHEDCIVLTQFPTGDGVATDFTPDTGSDNYARVDDNPSDEDTSYVEASTNGNQDLYTFAPISQTDILGVQVNLVCKTPSSTDDIVPIIRSGTTVYDGPTEGITTTYETAIAVFDEDPDTSSPWIYTDLNSAQFGGEIA